MLIFLKITLTGPWFSNFRDLRRLLETPTVPSVPRCLKGQQVCVRPESAALTESQVTLRPGSVVKNQHRRSLPRHSLIDGGVAVPHMAKPLPLSQTRLMPSASTRHHFRCHLCCLPPLLLPSNLLTPDSRFASILNLST